MKLVFICVICLVFQFGYSQSYPVRHFSTNDGLTSNIVYDALQDDQGYMWFVTNIGVSRFDGRTWKSFTIDQGLSDNEILKIHKDAKGRLWLFAFNGTVSVIEGDNVYNGLNHPLLKHLSKEFFYRSFYSNKNGDVWLSNKRTNSFKINLSTGVIDEKSSDSNVVFESDNGLVILDGKQFYKLPYGLKSGNNNLLKIYSWHCIGDSLFMAISDNHILKIDKKGNHALYPIELSKENSTIDFYFNDENEIWLSADKQGILHYIKVDRKYILKENLLKENYITSTFIDKEGNHWFTTYGSGIFMLPHNYSSIHTYTVTDGLKENDAFSVYVDSYDKVWVGHKYEYIDIISDNAVKTMQLTNSNVSVGRVRKIEEHPLGWMILSYDEGLIFADVRNPNAKTNRRVNLEIKNNAFMQEQPIKDFVIDKKGNVYIASQENINVLKVEDIARSKLSAKRIEVGLKRIFTIAVDSIGNIWYADSDGIAKIESGKRKRFGDIFPILKNRAEDMIWLEDYLFIAIVGHGIVVIRNEKVIKQLTTNDGILSNHCTRLFEKNGLVYVCSNQGLNKIAVNTDGTFKVDQISSSPLPNANQVNDIFIKGKNVYVATLNGITILSNTSSSNHNSSKPLLYFTEIKWKNKNIISDRNVTLDFNDRHIAFKFTSPTFFYPEGIKYEYKLNKNEWTELSNPALELSELRPGDYDLQIRTKNINTEWSKSISYSFSVERPFYLSWWFYLLIGSIIFAWFFYRSKMRLQRIQQEQKMKLEYEQEINQLQLKSLQAMMNPHFVFNSLSAIQQQINAGENQKANTYLTRFSKLLRKNLETINETYITIEEEISRLNLYLETEKMRFGDKLNYKIESEKDLDIYSIHLPTMLLQPLVENAIWHGIMPSDKNGEVNIYFKRKVENLIIEITDNGIGYNKSSELKKNLPSKNQHLGMQITKDRLKYLERKMGKTINISIHDLSEVGEQGTKIIIELPMMEEV